MQTGDKDGDGNGDNKCVAEFGTAKGDKKFVAKLATAGDGDKGNVALIGEGDNFKTVGRPKSATATNKRRPYRRRRYFSI